MIKKILISLIFCSTALGIMYDAFSNSNGQGGATSAPGELTCSQPSCHGAGNGEGSSGGLADNMGGGSISISGISGTYTPGTLYHLTVRVSQTGGSLFGFNCEALDASNGTTGTLTVTQAGTQLRQGVAGTRNGVSMGHAAATGSIAGSGVDFFDFTFDWTAPASSVGTIKFYAAGLAANTNALQDSGDNVYSTSLTLTPSVAPSAVILISRTTLTNPAFSALANTVGTITDLFVAGQSLSGNLTAAVTGSQFMISTSSTGPWSSSIQLTAASGTVSGTQIFIQYTGAASGTQTGTLTISGGGASSKSISLSGNVRTPTLSAPNPTALNFGTVNTGSGVSFDQTFTYTPTNPVGDIIITCPTGYEISLVSGRDYNSVIILKYFGFAFSPTVYVRLKNPQVAGNLNGNLTIATTGATTQTVTLTATVVNPTTFVLASTDYLSLFTSSPGTPSSNQTFNVNGSGLTSNLNVTCPANFEISLNQNSGFGSSVSIAPSAGVVNSTPVFVRYNSANAVLDFGTISVSSTGAVNQIVSVNAVCFGAAMPTITSSGTLTAFSTVVGTPSTSQSFTASGINLTANVLITAPTDFEVSLSAGSGYGSNVNITPTSGSVTNTTIYIRYNPASAGTQSGNITLTSTGATTQNIAVNGTSTTPTPTISTTGTLNPFSTMAGIPSLNQSFTTSGANLTGNLLITAPTDFEVSLSLGSGYGSSVSIPPVSGNVANTTIYVRYSPSVVGTANGNIALTSAGATTKNIAVSGTATSTPMPTLSSSGTLTAFSTVVGTPSSSQSFTASGINLTANVLITAPTEFEISLSSGSGYGSNVNITPTSGSVSNTIIYIRYNPASAGTQTGNIALTSTGVITQNIAVSGTSTTPTSIIDISQNESISIFPNPASDRVNIIGILNKSTIKIYNENGKMVLEQGVDSNTNINISSLLQGIYTIIVESNNSKSINKIIIEK